MIITLRIRSSKGVFRVQVDSSQTLSSVSDHIDTQADGYYLSSDPAGQKTLSPSTPLSNFANGDFVFLHEAGVSKDVSPTPKTDDRLDPVDKALMRRSGRMFRQLDNRACRHGVGGMCEHCQPLEPWQIPQIISAKHLPLHVHLRKHNMSTNEFFANEDALAAKHRQNMCKHHSHFERCSKCLQSTVNLKQQPFRLVDHVEFCDSEGVETVVNEWRRSGLQRFAWLFGEVVPRSKEEEWDLGIKSRVVVVYQPSQEGAHDGVRLIDDHGEGLERAQLASRLLCPNSRLIGCLYTDLRDDGSGTGKVQERGYFVSSPELTFMASQQSNLRRFVTCILSGSREGTIEIESYMASEEYVNGRISFSPSTNPNKVLVKQGEFTYSVKNEYGYEVMVRAKSGDTLPVEYFVVSLSHGFIDSPPSADPFPPLHMYPTVGQALNALESNSISFNLLMYLFDRFKLKEEDVAMEDWQNAILPDLYNRLLQASDGPERANGWVCPHCTFINEQQDHVDCVMCGLPRS